MGRWFVMAGLAIAALGLVIMLIDRLNFPIGRLPGDVVWRGKNSTFYFPWVSCLIVSALLSLVFWLMNRRP